MVKILTGTNDLINKVVQQRNYTALDIYVYIQVKAPCRQV